VRVSPEGRLLAETEWDATRHAWLPTPEDDAYVQSLMQPVTERGKFAGWIAPPPRGVNGQPVDFEYVRLA
jgi:benzoyl-CoA 2,3-dioxygenase component B